MQHLVSITRAPIEPKEKRPGSEHDETGRVVGTVVSTIKSSGLNSYKLLLVSPLDLTAGAAGKLPEDAVFVAIDLAGAGEDEIVLVTTAAPRGFRRDSDAPTDAAIVAVVDNVQIGERNAYGKG